MTCPICSGSGERDGEYGLLSCDAPNCTAATERAALEAANKAAEPMTVYDQRWFAYCAGKAAAKQTRKSIGDDADFHLLISVYMTTLDYWDNDTNSPVVKEAAKELVTFIDNFNALKP